MKSYTDLEQSKKLAEILPLESADMYWLNRHIDLTETEYKVFVVDKSDKYIDFFKSYAVAIDNNEIIPCWSLATLLDVLPHKQEFYPTLEKINDKYVCRYKSSGLWRVADNPVDACYEMILKLHEQYLI